MTEEYPQALINLHRSDLDKPIYRVFSIQRLLELIASHKNTLVRPALWDDPFENFILNAVGESEFGEPFSIGFKDDLYGQCWSTVRDSDALWRIYSPDKTGVRVRSTVGGLLGSLQKACGARFPELSCFIGRVQYLPQKKILRLLEDRGLLDGPVTDGTGRGQASTLLLKRVEFRHEQEIRLIYFNHNKRHSSSIYQYEFDPNLVIDEIYFDPRLSPELYGVYEGHLQRVGFQGKIGQSPLYKLPALRFRMSHKHGG
jgi:hypothetical protein